MNPAERPAALPPEGPDLRDQLDPALWPAYDRLWLALVRCALQGIQDEAAAKRAAEEAA